MGRIYSSYQKTSFIKRLLDWDATHNQRKQVWQEEASPYKVWIREIILQQTRLEQGFIYYTRFLKQFPSLENLAAAPEDKVFKAWEGLGYYNRCKNLINTARDILHNHNGIFPSTYEKLIRLKGIGDYTASAVLSFCFHQDYAVYDGNVERVLARYIGFDKDIKIDANRKELKSIAQDFLKKTHAAKYNQAIMDFGATICKPKQMQCYLCGLKNQCVAYKKEIQHILPIKKKDLRPKKVYWIFLHWREGMHIALQPKANNTLWKNLFLLPVIEVASASKWQEDKAIKKTVLRYLKLKDNEVHLTLHKQTQIQTLSHRKVHARFAEITTKKTELRKHSLIWVEQSQLHRYYFPVLIKTYLKQYTLPNPLPFLS